ncbi:MAG: HAD-IIA family hydrolase [Persicimonas sp.]
MARYEALLVDAYGVLVHTEGAFAGAAAFIQRLRDEQMPYVIITNDASRLPETCADKYGRDGLDIPAERIVTSGSLLTDYIADHGLQGARALVLGTRDSEVYAERAGLRLVDLDHGDLDVLVLGDEASYDFIPAVDAALTTLFRKLDAGEDFQLVVPNPDLIYQRSESSYGFTTGSIAALFERALEARYPGADLCFERLGKPFAPMFEEAVARAGTRRCAVLGDQLETDIRGANDFGLDSVLVETGLTDLQRTLRHSAVEPDFVLESLDH